MSNPLIMSVAQDTGKSVTEVENLWDRAKKIVSDEYDVAEGEDKFYALVVGVLKRMTGYESMGRANKILEATAAQPEDWDDYPVPKEVGYFYLAKGVDEQEVKYILNIGNNEGMSLTLYNDGLIGTPNHVLDFEHSWEIKYGEPQELKLPDIPAEVAVLLLDASIKKYQDQNRKWISRSGSPSTGYLRLIDYFRNVKKQIRG